MVRAAVYSGLEFLIGIVRAVAGTAIGLGLQYLLIALGTAPAFNQDSSPLYLLVPAGLGAAVSICWGAWAEIRRAARQTKPDGPRSNFAPTKSSN
jgi:hypothetical protein